MGWRWIRRGSGMVLAAGLLGGLALAQPAGKVPPPSDDKFAAPSPPPASPPSASPPSVVIPGEPPGVARFRALLGPDTVLTYGSAVPIDPATGSLRLLDARLARHGGTVAMAELTLDALGDNRIGAASARDVTFTGRDGGTATLARLELRGLATRGPGDAPGPATLMLDQLRLDGLTVTGTEQLAIAELVLEDYGHDRPGRVTLSGLDVLAPRAGVLDRLQVGRAALRGLDLAAVLAAIDNQAAPPRTTAAYALEIEEVRARQGDKPVGTLGALRVEGAAPDGGIETGRVALRALRLEPSPGLEDWLRRFRYPALVADLTAETRYDRASGRFELGSLTLAGQEMGVLGLSLALEGMTAEAIEAGDWQALKLAGIGLRYLDQSLYGRVVAEQARRTRVPEAKVRDQLAAQAAGALTGGSRAPPGVQPIVAAVQRFLRGEATGLEILARPPKPLPLAELPVALMGGPAAVQQALGLTATAK